MTTYVQHNPVSPVEQHARYFLKYMRGEVQAFQQHITGIPAESERAHYSTLMLLRMMVLYFLQPKVLLAADSGYLASHLRYMQEQYGKDRFYRNFLLPLFQHHRSSSEADSLLNVPTIHLFARHRIEQAYEEIQIADEAFVRLFALFDTYNWQLIEKKEDDEHTLYPT